MFRRAALRRGETLEHQPIPYFYWDWCALFRGPTISDNDATMAITATKLRLGIDYLGLLATGAPLAVALSALCHSSHRVPDLLAQFTAPVLFVTVIATVAALALRLKRSAMAGGVASALLLAAVWPQWFPARETPAAEAPVLTLYSANVWARNTDVAAIAQSIAAADPDIVLLVELGDVPTAHLDQILPNHLHRTRSKPGNITVAPARVLIASRWPLKRIPEDISDSLSAVAAIGETPLGPVGLISTHLTRPWPFYPQYGQVIQSRDLAKVRATLGDTAIITGDFNSVSSARIGRQIQQETGLVPAPARLGTWPVKMPAVLGITIDQVWHSTDLVVIDRKLGMPNGSDHRPVITRVTAAQAQHP